MSREPGKGSHPPGSKPPGSRRGPRWLIYLPSLFYYTMLSSQKTSGISTAYCSEISLKIPHLPLVSANRNTSLIWRRDSSDPVFYWNQRRRRGWEGRRKGEGEQSWGEPSVGINHKPTLSRWDSADACNTYVSADAVPAPAGPGTRPVRSAPRPAAPLWPHHLPLSSQALRREPRRAGQGGRARRGDEVVGTSAALPQQQTSNTQDYRLGRAYRRKFLSGSPGQLLALTPKGKHRGADRFLGESLACRAETATLPWKHFIKHLFKHPHFPSSTNTAVSVKEYWFGYVSARIHVSLSPITEPSCY